MKGFFLKRQGCAILAAFVVLSGCVHAVRYNATEEKELKHKKIAVLPFDNLSGKKEAGRIITEIYVSELFKTRRYTVEEPGNIRQFLVQERIDTIGKIEIERLKMLGRRLKVDAVLVGTVEEYDEGQRGTPVVAITARMVEASRGRIVWLSQHKRRGTDYIVAFEFGIVRSATKLAKKVVEEMVDTITW
jgi:TolB-like protein